MTHIALFHSVYGLRPAVLAAADRLRAAGHQVVTPDLYDGQVATTVDEGFALSERIGWPMIMQRARESVRDLPAGTVLAGLSMGTGVVSGLLAERRETTGLLLLHGTGGELMPLRAGLPVQLHIAQPDEYFSEADVTTWRTATAEAGAAVEVFTYPGVRHLFTDPEAADPKTADPEAADPKTADPGTAVLDEVAAARLWQRSLEFLDRI
ncbi:dienelactone hydrolase family protein [Micromonospora polyrhachis]|uniref:Dienelactone hydrolase n=1 Tax=Micromonospora polyrhachis TaxID=1282883 RepID=A0A7W7SMS6_9ACTN|nr:dienelactone hydrolase family protein [Micromonospora polyrhachis]MBB4957613.1 dienelactone hydrolase [Micromonospora polyrhachis]